MRTIEEIKKYIDEEISALTCLEAVQLEIMCNVAIQVKRFNDDTEKRFKNIVKRDRLLKKEREVREDFLNKVMGIDKEIKNEE